MKTFWLQRGLFRIGCLLESKSKQILYKNKLCLKGRKMKTVLLKISKKVSEERKKICSLF